MKHAMLLCCAVARLAPEAEADEVSDLDARGGIEEDKALCEYLALAKKTSALLEAMLFVFEPL